MKVILSVCSARPNFVKLAAVNHVLAGKRKDFKHVIVHTGQHYDSLLSDVFFTQLEIPEPNVNLGVKGGGDRLAVIEETAKAITPVLEKIKPDIVLVYGDVNGAVGAARAAKKLGIKIGHVEAGLRSFDDSMPEEHNRIEIDQLADLLFCSEQSGIDHLKKEKVKGEMHLVGNTMIDSLLWAKPIIERLASDIRKRMRASPGKSFAIATIHRPSNVDDPAKLEELMKFLGEVASVCPVSLPAHPRLKNALDAVGFSAKDSGLPLHISEPMDYLSFIAFSSVCGFIITDSGGIQEEAVVLGKRCFTLRQNTERPSTIESGSNVLIDLSKEEDRAKVMEFAKNPQRVEVKTPEFWDGGAGERIVEVMKTL